MINLQKATSYIAVAAMTLAACFAILLLFTGNARAASVENVEIFERASAYYPGNYNCEIGSFDITEDGVADEITFALSGSTSNRWNNVTISVNGMVAKTYKGSFYYVTAKYLQLSTGKQFLYVTCRGPKPGDRCDVLRFSGGKLKALAGNESIRVGANLYNNTTNATAVKNKIKIEHCPNTLSLAELHATFYYKLSNGKLKRTSSSTTKFNYFNYTIYKAGKSFLTAQRTIKIYRNSNCTKTKGKIKGGTKVKILKVHVKPSGRLTLYAKTKNGKKFWFKDPSKLSSSKYPSGCLFKEVHNRIMPN